ncbi:hypothetical protein [Arcanobacterium phocae]|uniref:Uncharacterized protein n=3 Tax=Arcanobacterium phocae TaxID=131112 RepID=A0A1H2LI13_9ACTO|nr:hypothetical protein [Arcanobacterium phocae]SDU80026.1 hypothetical protein SAMN04489737_1073 [Arcanobacterium phocae]
MSQPHISIWGYTKRKRLPALVIALPLGLLVGTVVGIISAYLRSDTDHVWLYAAIFSAMTGFLFTGLIWVLIVDRTTIAGAIAKPEASIENTWHARAVSAGFFTMLIGSSWGSAIAAFYHQNAISICFVIFFILGVCAYVISYVINRKRTLQ